MKWLLLIFSLVSAQAFADEKQEDGQMWGVLGPVPNPVPIGYPYCIRAVFLPSARAEDKVHIYFEPLSNEDVRILDGLRKHNLAKLEHCASTDT